MRRSFALLLWCILLSVSYAWAAELNSLPLGAIDYSGKSVTLDVSKNSPDFTTISLLNPNVVIENKTADYENYQVLGIPGEPFVFSDGAPSVPLVARMYRIPNRGSAELRIVSAEYDVIDNINPYPYQIEGKYAPSEFTRQVDKDPAVYSRDEWYPSEIATMSSPMIMRDFRVVRVALHPVQVNPVTHQARIYRNVQVEIVANDNPGINEIEVDSPPTGSWSAIYRNVIQNLDEDALTNAVKLPGTYLIVAKNNSTALQWADSLALWKRRCGYTVNILTNNSWSVSSMTTAIRNAYSNSVPKLEHVALIGDPQATFGVPTDDAGGTYDHSFALGNTGDDIEDFGVGRLSGSSATEMATINAKIMSYERNPWMQNGEGVADTMWFKKGFFYAGVGNEIASNWTLMQWAAQQFRNNTGVDSTYLDNVVGAVNESTVRGYFNSGLGVFFWRGSWLGQMSTGLANSFNSSWRLPICMCVTCGANEFSFGLGIAESYLVAGSPSNPKGGVASVGTSTSGTHAPQNVTFAGGLIYSISNLMIEHFGHAMNAGKIWLILAYGEGNPNQQNFTRWNNLMGEPGLPIWTDVPKVMNATHSATLNVGARTMHLNVTYAQGGAAVEDALVVLWKGDECYTKGYTDASGNIDLPITVNSTGDLLVTITKRGHKPYLANVTCNTVDQMVTVSSYTVDDDNSGNSQGNSDGIINPGEVIELPTYLRNFGNAVTGSGITSTLSSSNPRVSIVQANSSYANIVPGDSAVSATPYRIQISPLMQNGETALLTLSVTASSIQTQSSLLITCSAGYLDYVSQSFSAPLNPGDTRSLTVTLRNNGTTNLSGLTGQLISLSPFVSVDDPQGNFGSINAGAQGSNSGDQFTLRANTLTFRGHVATMRLITTTAAGNADTTQFTVTVGTRTGTDPTGPDTYGYYAYDNTDTAYEMHPTYSYVNISSNGGTNLNISDTGEKTSISQLYSTVRRLPFSFKYYGTVYDTVTICSNGWIAFGNQGWNDAFRNFPIPSMQAPDAMIAPYWDDLQTSGANNGVWHMYDETNHRYIVQWKGKGGPSSGGDYSTPLDFEVILYDSTFTPTLDGNGVIVMQYNVIAMNLPNQQSGESNGESIGIQSRGAMMGLPYAWQNSYTPGSATVSSGRAILFTTLARTMFGDIQGTVRDAETNLPLAGVQVSIDGYNYATTTDANGTYLLQDVLIGTYTLRSARRAYNDATVENVVVELDSVETVNFSMLHPEIDLSVDSIHVTVPSQPNTTSFNISNGGNGPLDYGISIRYAGNESGEPWDDLSNISVSNMTNDQQILGCEFANGEWWVTGGNGSGGQNYLYRFDYDGNLVSSVVQPTNSAFGWYDLAWDGTYLYGGTDNEPIKKYNPATGQVDGTIIAPLNPVRAIAFDSVSQHFWIGDLGQDIYEIDRNGNVIQQIENDGSGELVITGLAWYASDPDGFKLYIYSQNGAGSFTRVSRMHPATHQIQFVVNLPSNNGDHSGGCTITPGWNSTLLVFGAILQNSTSGDRLGIYQISFNTTWIAIAPSSGGVPGNGNTPINISFDTQYLRPNFTYRVNMTVHSDVLDSSIVVPVALTVSSVSVDPENPTSELPQSYALYQNYPNPFNPSTTIRYDLKSAGQTKLTIYNLMGQAAATLINEHQSAGSYSVNFDASSLGSGVYFYRLESGNFSQVNKMMLMK